MLDFVHKLEREFETQIIQSKEPNRWQNTFDLHEDGSVKSLFLYEVNLNNLDILVPISEQLQELWVQDCGIQNLSSLKHFGNLTKLCLDSNPLSLSTYENICHLTRLKELKLEGTTIEDTSLFSTLVNLEKLYLGYCNNLLEINGLEKLHFLKHLSLEFSQINTIKNIHLNSNIDSMNLKNSGIQKISDLDRYPNLSILELAGNPISKIEGLSTLKKLKRLIISSASLENIQGLEGLVNLEVLDLSNNMYTNLDKITGLDTLINLKQLNLNENRITKVENLDNLINLEYILLDANLISDFDTSFLFKLRSPCYISMIDNPLKEIKEPIPNHVEIQFDADHWMPRGL